MNLPILSDIPVTLYPAILIVGLTQVAKSLGLASKFLPLLAICLGALIVPALNGFLLVNFLAGAAYGLVVTGVVDMFKGH